MGCFNLQTANLGELQAGRFACAAVPLVAFSIVVHCCPDGWVRSRHPLPPLTAGPLPDSWNETNVISGVRDLIKLCIALSLSSARSGPMYGETCPDRPARPSPPRCTLLQRVRSTSGEQLLFNASWNQLTGPVPAWLAAAATHEAIDVSVRVSQLHACL